MQADYARVRSFKVQLAAAKPQMNGMRLLSLDSVRSHSTVWFDHCMKLLN
jgi:hypothetical protein